MLNVPGIRVSSDNGWNDVHLAELGDWRDLLHYVVAEERSLGHEGARVSAVNVDWFTRVDEVPSDVRRAITGRLQTQVREIQSSVIRNPLLNIIVHFSIGALSTLANTEPKALTMISVCSRLNEASRCLCATAEFPVHGKLVKVVLFLVILHFLHNPR